MRPTCSFCGCRVHVAYPLQTGASMIRHWAGCPKAPDDLKQECNAYLLLHPQREADYA